jgi:hypothetical protein
MYTNGVDSSQRRNKAAAKRIETSTMDKITVRTESFVRS